MRSVAWACGVLALVAAPGAGWAQEKPRIEDEIVVTEQGGVRFLSLRDWPVRRENDVIKPVTIEEYLSMKFKVIAEEFRALDRRLDAFEQRLHTLEQQEVSHGDTPKEPQADGSAPQSPQAADAPQDDRR